MFKVFIATLDMVMRDELTQVHGMEFFVDLTNYDSKHRAGISMEDRRKLLAHITAVSTTVVAVVVVGVVVVVVVVVVLVVVVVV